MQKIALLIDDEADLCRLMQMTLTKMGIKSDVAYDLQTALSLFDQNDYDFCLTDLALPDGSGLDMVKKVVSSGKNTPIAVITAHGTVDLAIEALKIGAFDFVNKPLELSRLRLLVENALKAREPSQNNSEQISPEDALLNERLIGKSQPMNLLRDTIKKLAKSQAPVFLWGASGTGKEVVAKLIHELSPRKDGSFVPVNCGAIPSELMESEFFGHKKGSFTGATTDKIGLFQQANGGTLFLDEVADLPLAMQVKLLRAIQEKTVRAIGDTKEVPVDIRILSATHKDLNQLVNQGLFRQDLFYRINVIMVKLPKLNQRREDIPLLAKHFLNLIAKDWQISPPTLSTDALTHLKKHNFEGNVRELRNLLERAVTMTDNGTISVDNLSGQNFDWQDKPTYKDNRTIHKASFTDMNTIKVGANYGTIFTNTEPVLSLIDDSPKLPTITNTNKPSTTNTNTEKSQTSLLDSDDDVMLLDDEFFGYNTTSTALQTDNTPFVADTPNQDNQVIQEPSNQFKHDTADELPEEGLECYLQSQEKTLIITALNKANGNKTQAAKLLGMTFRSLRYRMKKLEIDSDNTLDDLDE